MVVNITHVTSWVVVGLAEEPNSFGFAYITLLQEIKPGLDEKTIINDIVKLIYVFQNDLPGPGCSKVG